MATNDEIQIALDELETRTDRLRALYEQYFTGIEKAPPVVQHKDVERRIQLLRKMSLRNTAQRFRFQTLIQKYTTYLQYWQRMLRRIEDGTHKRDLARAARYGAPKSKKPASSDGVYELDPDAIEDYEEIDESAALEEIDTPTNERPALVKPATAQPAVVQPTPRATTAQPATRERQVEVMPFDVVEAPARTAPISASIAPPPNTAQPTVVQSALSQPAQPAKRTGLSVFGAGPNKTTTAQPALTKPAPAAQPASSSAPTAVRSPMSAPVSAPVGAPAPTAAAVTRPTVAQPAMTPATGATRPASTDAALRSLYERYSTARKANGEASVDFDVVAKQVRDTLPKLREKYPGQNVDLDVSVKDGRTILRPVIKPKK